MHSSSQSTNRHRDLPILNWSVGELEYLADNPGVLLIARWLALHQPGKQILVLAAHQLLEAVAIRFVEQCVARRHERLEEQIEFQHAASGGPTHAI